MSRLAEIHWACRLIERLGDREEAILGGKGALETLRRW